MKYEINVSYVVEADSDLQAFRMFNEAEHEGTTREYKVYSTIQEFLDQDTVV